MKLEMELSLTMQIFSLILNNAFQSNVEPFKISLAIHETEFHSDSPQRKSRHTNKICQISENSEYDSSSDSESDEELSKWFKLDVKDETEDDNISTDDEFNGKTK